MHPIHDAALGIIKLGILLGLIAPAAAEEGAKGLLRISATIAKHASLQVLAQPAALVITTDDIARGYVDVPEQTQIAIRSNTSSGYLLDFSAQADYINRAVVTGLHRDVQLGPFGGAISVAAAGAGMRRNVMELGFRIFLSQSARQGIHAWPLRLSVVPL